MTAAPPAANLLDRETSPYLLQHADNPVHWRAWGPDALAEAAAADKPILLSVGYAACHWCHVMAHESFEDPAIAAVMNELFVNIKVDREERPDLDTVYQSALALFGEQGGWPLTMFCTPDGKPFWGGTYFPPVARYGRPGFADLLRHVRRIYDEERTKVDNNSAAVLDALGRLAQPTPGTLPPGLIHEAAAVFAQQTDPVHGGIGSAPKFPHVPVFRLMLRTALETGNEAVASAVRLTLDRMAQGGIYDHLGGGFARYSTDAAWLVPHFEKMLYDNAQLVELYTEAWQMTRDPLYAERVAETCNWLLTDMQSSATNDCYTYANDCNAFFSALDADSEGSEGKYYVWTEDEIDTLLGDAAPAFKAAYDVTRDGNWEGHTILNRGRHTAIRSTDAEAALAASRAILLEARRRRIPPALDDKILADWNGLTIAALTRASLAFDRPDWCNAALAAFEFVRTRMQQDDHGEVRLHHSWRSGAARHRATLDDYAQMARAALILHEATGGKTLIAQAQRWTETLDRYHWDAAYGGYYLTAYDADDIISRPKNAHDNAAPSGNGTMVEVLARLHHLTGKSRYRDRADALISAFAGEIEKNAFPYATLMIGAPILERAVQIIIVGTRGEPDTGTLLAAAAKSPSLDRIISIVEPGTRLPSGHPASNKQQQNGAATAYVCIGQTCSLPTTDPQSLADMLGRKS
ncbi:MAG: thioredoxin domain-containing protein [Alphaproteobacteria bacterium]